MKTSFKNTSDEIEYISGIIKSNHIKGRDELWHKFPKLYKRLRKLNLLDSILPKLAGKGIYTKYSDDDIINHAKQYHTLSEFRHKDYNRYQAALKRGLLPSFTFLLKANVKENTSKMDCVYVYEFTDTKTAYVGRTVDRERRHTQHLDNSDSVRKYALSIHSSVPNMKILEDDITVHDGQLKEAYYIDYYLKNGWTLLNKAKAGSTGNFERGYSKKQIKLTISRYSTLEDFYTHEKSMYNKVIRYGWYELLEPLTRKVRPYKNWESASIEEIINEAKGCRTTGEFHDKCTPAYYRAKELNIMHLCISSYRRYWENATEEEVTNEAKKYKTRNAFRDHSSGAYDRAIVLGILDKIMPKKTNDYTNVTDEYLLEKASHYHSASEFYKNNQYLYKLFIKRKLNIGFIYN